MTISAKLALLAIASVVGMAAPCIAQQQSDDDKRMAEIKKLAWQAGPSQGVIGGHAGIAIPDRYIFLGAADTSRFLTLLENLPAQDSYTFAPRGLAWFVVFAFSETGYIKDDEKIDPDAILAALKEGTDRENEERKKRGFPALTLDGWAVVPHYDEQTKRLEWATRLKMTGGTSINYSIRMLGRTGVMKAILVTDPQTLDADVRDFKAALGGFAFNPGERYAEYTVGDKVAEYGLTGLIIGGAAAAAAKFGLFKFIGKFAVFIFAGVAAFAGAIWRWLTGRRKTV